MKKLFGFIIILLIAASCTVTPGFYSTNYSYNSTPVVTVVQTPTYNPYLYNPYIYRPRVYVNPYPSYYRWSYHNPRPRTTTVIVNTNNGNHHYQTGPRGGRRK